MEEKKQEVIKTLRIDTIDLDNRDVAKNIVIKISLTYQRLSVSAKILQYDKEDEESLPKEHILEIYGLSFDSSRLGNNKVCWDKLQPYTAITGDDWSNNSEGQNFKITLGFSFLKRKFIVEGNHGTRQISFTSGLCKLVPTLISEILKPEQSALFY